MRSQQRGVTTSSRRATTPTTWTELILIPDGCGKDKWHEFTNTGGMRERLRKLRSLGIKDVEHARWAACYYDGQVFQVRGTNRPLKERLLSHVQGNKKVADKLKQSVRA